MTQRNDDIRNRPVSPTQGSGGYGRDVTVTQANITPADRVRWGPIWAGIFAAISTMFLMGLLGAAIGLSVYDARDNARGMGIGAGVWQLITVLAGFFVGGWVAGRTGGYPARRTGWINGALVWAVTIPLLMMLLASGVTGLISSASGLAQAVPEDQRRQLQSRAQSGQSGDDMAQQASARISEASEAVRGAATGENPPDEQTVKRAQVAAWWTFASFALGLAAAGLGGGIGSRQDERRDRDETLAA